MSKTQTLTKPTTEEEEDVYEALPTENDSADVLAETDALLDEIESILEEMPEAEKPFTLADAIREGSSVTNQAIGSWTGSQGETCALAAAALSITARGLK